jgi:hypothetical protein
MRKRVPVIIRWDRDRPPTSGRYVTMARFPDKEADGDAAWSIILHVSPNLDHSEEKWRGEAEF